MQSVILRIAGKCLMIAIIRNIISTTGMKIHNGLHLTNTYIYIYIYTNKYFVSYMSIYGWNNLITEVFKQFLLFSSYSTTMLLKKYGRKSLIKFIWVKYIDNNFKRFKNYICSVTTNKIHGAIIHQDILWKPTVVLLIINEFALMYF